MGWGGRSVEEGRVENALKIRSSAPQKGKVMRAAEIKEECESRSQQPRVKGREKRGVTAS